MLLNYQLPAAGPLTPDDYDVRDGFAQRWGKTDGWTGKNIMLLRLGSGASAYEPSELLSLQPQFPAACTLDSRRGVWRYGALLCRDIVPELVIIIKEMKILN